MPIFSVKQQSVGLVVTSALVRQLKMASSMRWVWARRKYTCGTRNTLYSCCSRSVTNEDYKPLESIATKIIKEKQKFERLVVSKENLLEMFKHNKYKQVLINSKIPDGTSTTVYRCGPLIDLCRGPHVPHTGRIKAFQILKVSPLLSAVKFDSNYLELGLLFSRGFSERVAPAYLWNQFPRQEAA